MFFEDAGILDLINLNLIIFIIISSSITIIFLVMKQGYLGRTQMYLIQSV
ncbi:hypothetical protein pb186bvf_020129 [Paramecium bursaria]